MKRIALSSDHAGYEMKEALKAYLDGRVDIIDLGTNSDESVDYPDFGKAMGEAITGGRADQGILVCGSGIGISIAANRFPLVRAALCTSAEMAGLSRQHNDANVLALGARIVDNETAKQCVDTFLNTNFEGGRHQRRIDKMNE